MDYTPSAGGVKRKACINCTTAKAKCTSFAVDLCERCHRLGKNCAYIDVSTTKRKPRDTTRVQQLEEKVDNLVEQLAALTKVVPASSIDHGLSTTLPATASRIHRAPTPTSLPSSSGAAHPNATPVSNVSSTPMSAEEDGLDIIDRGLVSLHDAKALLEVYRNSFVLHFPFVALDANVTVDSLRRESPFLFLSIMAVTMSSDSRLQRVLGYELKKLITSRMILRCEKSMDLLQGLLVHGSFFHFFFQPTKQQMFLMLQLCLTLLYELGLDKHPKDKKLKFIAEAGLGPESESVRTPAEKRALLGTYSLLASYAMTFRRQSPMNYTRYMEQCCQSLAEANEAHCDGAIKHRIQLQVLSRKISDSFSYENVENTTVRGEAATKMTTDALLYELEFLKTAVSSEFANHPIIRLEFYFLDTYINEVAFHDEFWETPTSFFTSGAFATTSPASFSVTRCNMLWHSLGNIKAWLHTFASLPTLELFHLSFTSWSKLCYMTIALARIVFFNPEEHGEQGECSFALWDSAQAIKEAELPRICALLLEKIDSITSDIVGEDGERDAMYNFGFILRSIMGGYERRIKRRLAPVFEAGDFIGSSQGAQGPLGSVYPTPSVAQDSLGQDKIGVDGGLAFGVPADFPSESFEDMIWESILDDFTMLPLP